MALSRVVSDIFNIEKYRDLEIPVNSQVIKKVVQFDRQGHRVRFPVSLL